MTKTKWMPSVVAVVAFTNIFAQPAWAKLELPRVFGDNVVLQRDKPLNVWGKGNHGDSVTVTFGGQTAKTKVGADGKWLLTLKAMPACAKAQELKVKSSKHSLTFKNVLVGDVWLCSGQSNMESTAGGIIDSDLDMPRAKYDGIRCLTIPLTSSPTPKDNFHVEERNPYYVELKGVWRTCTPKNAADFPAVGYQFARLVHEITGVPIGLIDNSWGGSVVETWISRKSLEGVPDAKDLIKHFDHAVRNYSYEAQLAKRMGGWQRHADKAKAAGKEPGPKPVVSKTYVYRQNFPSGCFNSMIAPIQKFAIKGVIFYQGINNCVASGGRPNLYMKTFPALIPDWRKAFGDPEMPFCIVQMTSFGWPVSPDEPEITVLHKAAGVREAQTKAHLKHKNTGLVCTYDLGHIQMHSPFKKPIGQRAARWALADVYKIGSIKYNPPMLESWKKEGKEIILTFNKGSYPSSPYGMRVTPKGFVIAGADKHFYRAECLSLKGGTFGVSSPFVDDPVSVRYAWGVHPIGNFGNRAGPAVPFRTDNWAAWVDYRIDNVDEKPNPQDAKVPTVDQAKTQAWTRKAAQAKKVLEEYEAWKKKQKPRKPKK
jgi:sialate O-acetylesterase